MKRIDAVGDHQLRETLLFVRARPLPVTAADVARALDLPRTVARWRLERLADAGLLETAFDRRTKRRGPGAGRPAKTYAPAVETAAIELPARRYDTLVGLLGEALPRRRRDEALREAGIRYARSLAADMRLRPAPSVPAAVQRVCRGLGRLGFHAAVADVSTERATVVSATCPLRPLVVERPELAPIDEGMWIGLIAAATGRDSRPRVSCRRDHCFDAGARCRIHIEFASAR